MPRFEYRPLMPQPPAEKAFEEWIGGLDRQFSASRDYHVRSEIVRDALHELYLGRPWSEPRPDAPLAERVLVHSFDPRNTTLEPEYSGDVDAARYNERKPLIWFWMMFDRSPA